MAFCNSRQFHANKSITSQRPGRCDVMELLYLQAAFDDFPVDYVPQFLHMLGTVVLVVEVQPEFPGGMKEMMKFIQCSLKYPEAA